MYHYTLQLKEVYIVLIVEKLRIKLKIIHLMEFANKWDDTCKRDTTQYINRRVAMVLVCDINRIFI